MQTDTVQGGTDGTDGAGDAGSAAESTESGGLFGFLHDLDVNSLNLDEILIWIVLAVVLVAALFLLNHLLLVRPTLEARTRNQRRWLMLASSIVVVVAMVLTLPIQDSARVALLQAMGLAVTALITLSSTTIAANMMAGIMLGRVGAFRPGDFVRVHGPSGVTFGRVTDRGLFHVEIQSEERDLVTLPNSYMITNPVRVVRQSGTIITCELSLGYDLPHTRIEVLLSQAATASGLEESYVQVRELGDFSVTYRVCGFLKDTKSLITARSRLRSQVLDTLHGAGVEIVSPTFMNQRRVEEPVVAVEDDSGEQALSASTTTPESIIFDKAEDAERIERVRTALDDAKQKMKDLEASLGDAEDEAKAEIKSDIEHQKKLAEYLTSRIDRLEQAEGGDGK